MTEFEPDYRARVRALPHTKRGRALFEYLVKHGEISTEEIRKHLKEKHPPSAVRDLRDRGVAVKRVMRNGVGVYSLDPEGSLREGLVGRKGFSKDFKQRLIDRYGSHCLLCGQEFESRFLQPDHRVPQRVGGDEEDAERNLDNYMPVCRSCNRSKSFECERCPNWNEQSRDVCISCFWARPDSYEHVAKRVEKRSIVVWTGAEDLAVHEALTKVNPHRSVVENIKDVLRSALNLHKRH